MKKELYEQNFNFIFGEYWFYSDFAFASHQLHEKRFPSSCGLAPQAP
jgi:hypothetical protein